MDRSDNTSVPNNASSHQATTQNVSQHQFQLGSYPGGVNGIHHGFINMPSGAQSFSQSSAAQLQDYQMFTMQQSLQAQQQSQHQMSHLTGSTHLNQHPYAAFIMQGSNAGSLPLPHHHQIMNNNMMAMNHQQNSHQQQYPPSSYSWQGVMDFLKDQELKAHDREQKLINDKKLLEERVKALEEELQKQVQVNKDLVKKMRVIEYQMLQSKKKIKTNTSHVQNSTIGTAGSGSGHAGGGGTIGPITINPSMIKRPRHQRGNSDGVYNIASRLFTSNHTRGSSGSGFGNKTFEENIDNGVALLSQTLELVQENTNTNSRTLAHNNFNHSNIINHHKTNSSETQETIESQQYTKIYKQLQQDSTKQFLFTTSSHSIPQKRRQISNGSQQICQQTLTQPEQQLTQSQQQLQKVPQQTQQQQAQQNKVTTITTTTTITQSSAPKSGEIGQRRKWLVQESQVLANNETQQQNTFQQHQAKVNESINNAINQTAIVGGQSLQSRTQSAQCPNRLSKAQQLTQVINQHFNNNTQTQQSNTRPSMNALNTSAHSALSGSSKQSHLTQHKSHHPLAMRKVLYHQNCQLKSHLDGVRGVHFISQNTQSQHQQSCLVSVGEDGTVKAWEVKRFSTLKDAEGLNNLEPYLTLRGHKEPIMCLSSGGFGDVVVTGTSKGNMKAWKIPSQQKVGDPYGPAHHFSNNPYCIASWDQAHENDPIWDIRLHSYEQLFLSVGSDYSVGLWQLPQQSQSLSNSFLDDNSLDSGSVKHLNIKNTSPLLGRFRKCTIQQQILMPTSACWMPVSVDSNGFLISYSDQPLISLFDASTGKEKGMISFAMDHNKSPYLQQINKIVVSESQKLIITGTEDNMIRLFDLNSHKPVKNFVAHTDAITSLLIQPSCTSAYTTFLSGSHDGSVRAWDLRTFQCVYDNTLHRKKYDEGVLALAASDQYPIIATGGADSLIKIIHEQ